MNFGCSCIRRCSTPGSDRLFHVRSVGAETLRQCFKEGNARANSEVGVAAKNFTCKRDARSLATAGQKTFAQFDQALGTSGGIAAPIARKKRTTALGNGLQQFPEERGVHFSVRDP